MYLSNMDLAGVIKWEPNGPILCGIVSYYVAIFFCAKWIPQQEK